MTASREQLDSCRAGSTHAADGPPTAGTIVNVASQIAVSRATELARAGRYEDAEALLEDLVPAGLPPAALDLLARIRAQQSRWAEAKSLWLQLSQIAPFANTAQAALKRIAQIEERHARRGSFLFAGYARLRRSLRRRTVEGERFPRDVFHEFRVNVPGVVVRQTEGEVIIAFDFHLFSGDGATLEKKGKQALSALGWQLEPYVGRISIQVVGQPDALPQDDAVPRDVAALGMARAVSVFSHLTDTTKLQARMFSLRTGEDFLMACSNNCSDGKLRPAMVLYVTELNWETTAPRG